MTVTQIKPAASDSLIQVQPAASDCLWVRISRLPIWHCQIYTTNVTPEAKVHQNIVNTDDTRDEDAAVARKLQSSRNKQLTTVKLCYLKVPSVPRLLSTEHAIICYHILRLVFYPLKTRFLSTETSDRVSSRECFSVKARKTRVIHSERKQEEKKDRTKTVFAANTHTWELLQQGRLRREEYRGLSAH